MLNGSKFQKGTQPKSIRRLTSLHLRSPFALFDTSSFCHYNGIHFLTETSIWTHISHSFKELTTFQSKNLILGREKRTCLFADFDSKQKRTKTHWNLNQISVKLTLKETKNHLGTNFNIKFFGEQLFSIKINHCYKTGSLKDFFRSTIT